MTTTTRIPPVHRTISVPWDQARAFRRFTTEIALWWPMKSHSVSGEKTKVVVFEERVGGAIYEESVEGARHEWGRVRVWEPPGRVVFTWHPGRPEATEQEVELRFIPEAGGTRLELTHRNWENFGKRARIASRGYRLGWTYVLTIWAGRRTMLVRVMDGISKIISLVHSPKPA